MFKDLIIVSIGSFFGGGLRFLVSKGIQTLTILSFPFGTLTVNVLGCLVIGFLSGILATGAWLSPSMKLMLTTGLCGGFTTFSTFMHESSTMAKNEDFVTLAIYITASLVFGMIAVLAGHAVANSLR